MQKNFLPLFITLISLICSVDAKCFDVDLAVDIGYRRDYFKLDMSTPVLVSNFPASTQGSWDAKWKDLNIFLIGGHFQINTSSNFYLRGRGDYGIICNGKNKWNDPYTSEFTMPFPGTAQGGQFKTGKTKGDVWDVTGGLGYQFKWQCNCNEFIFAPIAGYSYYGQKLHESSFKGNEFFTLISPTPPAPLPLYTQNLTGHGKDSYQWNGPWLGIDLGFDLNNHWHFLGGYEYHWGWLKYKTTQRLTRPTTFVNPFVASIIPPVFNEIEIFKINNIFLHGQEATLGVEYEFVNDCCNSWWNKLFVGLSGNFKYWYTKNKPAQAIDIALQEPEANVPLVSKATVNKLRWVSWSISLDTGINF